MKVGAIISVLVISSVIPLNVCFHYCLDMGDQQNKGHDVDIPRRKQLLRHLPLTEIEGEGRARSDWMREAYCEHGYTMQAIADYAGLHHSTVSLSIKEPDNNPRIKA